MIIFCYPLASGDPVILNTNCYLEHRDSRLRVDDGMIFALIIIGGK